jgi:hypothetical protein
VFTGAVAADERMVLSVVPCGKGIANILDSWEGHGRHAKGEDGEEGRELHVGMFWVKRVALERSDWWC